VKASVILAHPRPGSFNHAVAAAAVRGLRGAGYEVRAHDLYAEGFDPRLHASELETTVFADELAARHAAEILEADHIVVVHPSWFFQVPAVLKGWVDRVLREGVAFTMDDQGVHGLLRARRALVVTTANAPHRYEVEALGDPLSTFWRTCVFGPAGVAAVERTVLGPIRGSTLEARRRWLERVEESATRGPEHG
jgi:putative NADPH-quinone reductase